MSRELAPEFDRRQVNCHHGSKLYECPDPEHSTATSVAGRGHAQAKTVTYYQGTADVYTNITDRDSDMFGGSSISSVQCKHRHRNWREAEKCGTQLAIREARRLNKERGIG